MKEPDDDDWDRGYDLMKIVVVAIIALLFVAVYTYFVILPPDSETYYQRCSSLEDEDPYFTERYENGSWPSYDMSEAQRFQPAIAAALDGERIPVNESYHENRSPFFVERNDSVYLCSITTPGNPA